MPTKTPIASIDRSSIAKRLKELQGMLSVRLQAREDLRRRALTGRNGNERSAAVAALISDGKLDTADHGAEWSRAERAIKDTQEAIRILEGELADDEVRHQQSEVAAPLFMAARAVVPEIAAALAEVERVLVKARRAIDAFDVADVESPNVKSTPYDRYALLPLRVWCYSQFLGDYPGDTHSQYALWLAEARTLGYRI
jgi:hypothetical protein